MNEQALKDRLQIISREKGIHFNECWKKLLLERFLSRLSRSKYTQKFIFKGGFLLAYLISIGRETTDLDFLLINMNANEEELKKAVDDIIATEAEDGFSFTFTNIEPLEQPHMDYPGFRIDLRATFGRMKDKIQIDVGIGDAVNPTTRDFTLFRFKGKAMFESEISLLVYPSETIFAEKLETVISKGTANSRMKDYHDLLLLTRVPHALDFNKLHASIKSTFHHRGTAFELINFNDLQLLGKLWAAHIKNLGITAQELNLPVSIQDVILEINKAIMSIGL
jgi:predicted nucleotidyltransferase component of viral defense system